MKNNFKVTSNENKTYTLTLKLWGYFVFFAISIFVILWFMQVILLQSYYSSMKKAEVSKLVEQIERNYDEENIKDTSRAVRDEALALCSYRLVFSHPVTRKKLTFEVIPKGKSFALFSEDFGKKDNI